MDKHIKNIAKCLGAREEVIEAACGMYIAAVMAEAIGRGKASCVAGEVECYTDGVAKITLNKISKEMKSLISGKAPLSYFLCAAEGAL